MKKNLMALVLLIVLGVQGEISGLFSRSEPYWTPQSKRSKWSEARYGREEGVEYGREQALLGAAGAYAGYQALNWAYNKWFRNEEKHIENLFDRVKKTATEIKQSADKVSNKPIEEGKQQARAESMGKARLTANLIEAIAGFYEDAGISSAKLLELKTLVDNTAKEKSVRVRMLTPKVINTHNTRKVINAKPKTLE